MFIPTPPEQHPIIEPHSSNLVLNNNHTLLYHVVSYIIFVVSMTHISETLTHIAPIAPKQDHSSVECIQMRH